MATGFTDAAALKSGNELPLHEDRNQAARSLTAIWQGTSSFSPARKSTRMSRGGGC